MGETARADSQFRDDKIVYRRYAGLFFCVCVDSNDNELAYLEAIHLFVEVLDAFFQNVCELDLVFSFYKVSGSEGCRGAVTAGINGPSFTLVVQCPTQYLG